jgi:hypothetical protein
MSWICFCTAEVRGSNPLGSTLEKDDLQEKCKLQASAAHASKAFVQQPCSNADGGCEDDSQLLIRSLDKERCSKTPCP